MSLFCSFRNRLVVSTVMMALAFTGTVFAQNSELLTNGNFSIDSLGKAASWIPYDSLTAISVRDTAEYFSAPSSLKMTGLPLITRKLIQQNFTSRYSATSTPPAVPGETLSVSFYIKGRRSCRPLQFVVESGSYAGGWVPGAYKVYTGMQATTTWTKFSYAFVDTAAFTDINISFQAKDSAVFWLDDVSIMRKADVAGVRPAAFRSQGAQSVFGAGTIINLGKQTAYRMVLLDARGSECAAQNGVASAVNLAPRNTAAGWYVARVVTRDNTIIRNVLVK